MAGNPAPGFTTHSGYNIELEANQTARITTDGEIIAETNSAIRMLEGNYTPVLYTPRKDVIARLSKSAKTTYCPFKGTASYWNIIVDGATITDAAWSYEEPYDEMRAIKGYLAFYPDKLNINQQ